MKFFYSINGLLFLCFMGLLFLLSIFAIIRLKIKTKQEGAEKYFSIKKLIWYLFFLSLFGFLYPFLRWGLLKFGNISINNILGYYISIIFCLLSLILIIFVVYKKEFKGLFIFCLILSIFVSFVEVLSFFNYHKSDDYYIEKYNQFEQNRIDCLKKCIHIDDYNLSNFKKRYELNYGENPKNHCPDDVFFSYDDISCYSGVKLFQDSFSEDEKIKIQEEYSCKEKCGSPLLPGNWLPSDNIEYLKKIFD